MLLNPLTVHSPKDVNEAIKLFSELDSAKFKAGGTFLLNSLKLAKRKGAKTTEHVISLKNVSDLSGINVKDGTLIIKAMTTIDELFESDILSDNFSILKTVCRNISTQPIRNMATIGGNLTCRYTWTEMPAVMIGLKAKMHFIDKDQNTSECLAEDFFKAQAKTDKLFTHLSIDNESSAKISYKRVKKSQFVDIPMLSMLINTKITDGNFSDTVVSLNNCVDFAQRDTKLEGFLNGKLANEDTINHALENIEESIYDKRANDYKKLMFRYNLSEALKELIS